jgi:transposase InsO family protein
MGEGAKAFGEEVHSDVWGPARVETKGGKHYYVTFIDNYSQWTHVDFLANKSDTLESYKSFDTMCETQFSTRIKALHSDRGGEYTANEFQSYLKSHRMKQKLTIHDTLQHNGIAER